MWIPDVDPQVTATSAVYVVAATQTEARNAEHKLGVCKAINYPTSIFPDSDASLYYLHEYLHKDFNFAYEPDGKTLRNTQIQVIQPPEHGQLVRLHSDAISEARYEYEYTPDPDFGDDDHFAIEIKADGVTVQIYYTMRVSLPTEGNLVEDEYGHMVSRCHDLGSHWKISEFFNANNLAGDYSWEGSNFFFTNLPGSTLAQTTGTGLNPQITFDTNAAGYAWFVDATPSLTDKFLPTPTRYEWSAKTNITGLVFPVSGR